MRYFTRQWYASDAPDAEERFAQYRSYLSSVRARLPPALLELDARHTLHDARVLSIDATAQAGPLRIAMRGWDAQLSFPVRYILEFDGVLERAPPDLLDAEATAKWGELAYWECAALEGHTEVSMLFTSGAELRVGFRDFRFAHERVV